MKIKIGNKQIVIWVSRTKDHKDYIWNNIYMLRQDIIEDVLSYNRSGIMPVEKLKHKADLIKKYSQRLKLLEM
tara:strand:- start:1440 stop:1658 length:219 start_codon:yes stop_codon:yes gene_type:complete